MNQGELSQPQPAEAVHEFVLVQSIKPNRQTDVKRLQRSGFLLAFMTHMNDPVNTGSDEVQTALMNPLSPITSLIAHMALHFFLLALINTGHARNGDEVASFWYNDGEHVPLFSAWVAHEKVRMGARVLLRLG